MPWNVTIEPNQQLVICRLEGRVTFDDVVAARDAAPQHPSFREDFNHLIDLSDVSQWLLSPDDMRRLASEPDAFSSRSIRIIVAPGDYIFGMARLYEITGERQHPNQGVVRSMEEARTVLRIGAA